MARLTSRAVAAALALASLSLPPVTLHAAPQLTIQSERAAHPRLAKTITDLEDADRSLQADPDDFGGHKAKALEDLHTAIHSLKRALYYRLKLDDAALDAAQ